MSVKNSTTIALLYRKKGEGRISIEGVFEPIDRLGGINRIELPCDLNSIKNIIRLIWFALHIKEKNIHITGDIHYMAIFLFWKKIIITVHDCNRYEDLKGVRKYFMGLIWYTWPLRIANKITVISPYAKEQLCSHFRFNYKKIVIIPNSFHPINKIIYNKNEDVFIILSVGSMILKNRIRMIQAVKNMQNVKLCIIGKLSEDMKELLEAYNLNYQNEYLITREKLDEYYNKADVLFFASIKEGFGLPILEAQSCGLPVITSNTTSMPFVVGSGGCIVNPFEVNEIRDAIVKIRKDLNYRSKIINNGFENIKRFSEKKFVKTFQNLHLEVFKLNEL